MLELAHGADCDIVLVGDPDLSDAGWAQFAQVSAGYVDLQCELESGYAYVRGQIHHDRPDSSVLIFRSQESRTTLAGFRADGCRSRPAAKGGVDRCE